MIDYKRVIMIIIYLLILISISAFVTADLVSEVLSPFETTDFSEIYNSYSSIIDFIIYTILFVGLSQVTIGKHFEAKGGKAVVVAVGLVLAIGLTISESYLGFNLRSFGPLAATLFIFLVGLVIFLGIKSAGMETVGAISITLVLTYFSIRSVSPGYFDWMINNKYLSWLHSVILIAVFISIYKIFRLFFSRNKKSIEPNQKGFFNNAINKPKEIMSQIKEERDELDFIRKKLEIITNDSGKDSKQIIKDLQELKRIITEYGSTAKGRNIIAQKIEFIGEHEKQIHKRLDVLREMIGKVSSFDIKHFEKLQKYYNSLSSMDKQQLEKQLKLEWKKLGVDKQLIKLDEAVFVYDKLFSHHLGLVISSLKSNKINDSIKHITEAIKNEHNLANTIQQIEGLEKKIELFTNKGLKHLEKSL